MAWSFSVDGGVNWQAIALNEPVTLSRPARVIVLRAELLGTATVTPRIDSYTLTVSCSEGEVLEEGLRFTGKEMDTGTGLVYFGARYYDPEVARWTTVDPARHGLNWYEYCGSNPLRYIDPNGQKKQEKIGYYHYQHTFTKKEEPGFFAKLVTGAFDWAFGKLDRYGVSSFVNAFRDKSDYDKMLGPLGVGLKPEAGYTFDQTTTIIGDYNNKGELIQITVTTSWSYVSSDGRDKSSGEFTLTFVYKYCEEAGGMAWTYQNRDEIIYYSTLEELQVVFNTIYNNPIYDNQATDYYEPTKYNE